MLRVLSSELGAAFTAHLREDERQEQRWLRAQLRELLTRGSRDGELFAEDPAMAAFVLAGAVEGILAQWCAAAQDVEPFCDPRHLATVLVAPYRSRGPRRADDEDDFLLGRVRHNRGCIAGTARDLHAHPTNAADSVPAALAPYSRASIQRARSSSTSPRLISLNIS